MSATILDVDAAFHVRGAILRLFERTPTGELVISGPSGTGKTRGTLEWIHYRCQQEKLRVLILRKTLESAKASVLVTLREHVLLGFSGKHGLADGVSYFGGNRILPGQFTYHDTGSTIDLAGMDNIGRVLSTEYDIIFVNECTELRLGEWEQLTGRTDRPSLVVRPPNLLIGDCNPDAPTHWIKRRQAAKKLTLWQSYHEDNAAMWDADRQRWTVAGLRYLATLDRMTGVRRLRYRFGKWAAAEGQVYEGWNPDVHVIPRDDLGDIGVLPPARVLGGVDWGMANPGVIDVAYVGGDGEICIVHETYRVQMPNDWWMAEAARLRTRYGIEAFICDPSRPDLLDAWRTAGLNPQPAITDIVLGIGAVAERLAPDANGRVRWWVLDDANETLDPRLLETDGARAVSGVQEVERYVWPTAPPGTRDKGTRDKPVDADNHAMDTWRYIALAVDRWGKIETESPEDLLHAFDRMGV